MTGAWLLLDTAAPTAVVALWRAGALLGEVRLAEARRHAESLADAIDRVLLAAGVPVADLAGVGVGVGPGSFIGVRIGLSTAKGIALARSIPLLGLPTLEALASEPTLPEGAGVVCLDARRGELYFQRARRTGASVEALDEPRPGAPDAVAAAAEGAAFLAGTGLDAVPPTAGVPRAPLPGPSGEGLGRALEARLARDPARSTEVFTLVPMYCRPPDAKLPAQPADAGGPTTTRGGS